jgi:hypothetical protein
MLMSRKYPDARSGEADLQLEKQGSAVGECESQYGIGFLATACKMAKRQECIQERGDEHEEGQDHGAPCETIDGGLMAFPSSPETFSLALPTEGMRKSRWAGPSIR